MSLSPSSAGMHAPGLAEDAPARGERAVAVWLLTCCALVFAMVVVGGITRLTHSGLSIVEWQPIVGALPPLNENDWQEAFRKYQDTPQFQQVNPHMDLAGFKGIFWWEYIHRLLGRLIGAAFLLPLVWFAARGRVPRALMWKLAGIFVLGGLQGAMGWYMVQSGLVDNPRVSQYRLAAHLALALAIYAAMLWIALGVLLRTREPGPRGLAFSIAALVFVQAIAGSFVAGIRAGLAYNTFPLMNGHVIPPGMFVLEPWYLNFFSNIATVQFDHRLIAWILAALVPLFWLRTRSAAPRVRLAASLMLAALALQIALGIATLLAFVPVPLAAAHQAGALLLLTTALLAAHTLR